MTRFMSVAMAILLGALVPGLGLHAAPASFVANAAVANATEATSPAPPVTRDVGLSDGLERVISAQANQINTLTIMIATMGLLFTLGGLGFVSYIIKRVNKAVDDRAIYLIERKVDLANLRSTRLNAAFYSNLLDMTRDVAYARRQNILQDIDAGRLDLANRDNFDDLVSRATDILITPLHIFANIQEIVASTPESSNVREHVWMLYAEVRADNILPKTMRAIVRSMSDILEGAGSRSPALPLLKAFSVKLAGVSFGERAARRPRVLKEISGHGRRTIYGKRISRGVLRPSDGWLCDSDLANVRPEPDHPRRMKGMERARCDIRKLRICGAE